MVNRDGSTASLEIQFALRDLLARSSDCVWRHDTAGYAQCWAADGEWHIMGGVIRGREAIAANWRDRMARYARVWQENHNVVFGFDRDQPVGRVMLQEHLITEGEPVKVLKGVYHDVYVCEGGTWRFASRHIDIAYIGPADLTGRWFPMLDHGPAPHDPDPSRLSTPSAAEVAKYRNP